MRPKKYTIENGGLVCGECKKTFKRRTNLIEHVSRFHSKQVTKNLICNVNGCGYRTNRIGNLHLHQIKKHKLDLKKNKCFSENCSVFRFNENSLINHMETCKSKPKFNSIKCHCGERFLSDEGFKLHIEISHNNLSFLNWKVSYKDLMNLKDVLNFN